MSTADAPGGSDSSGAVQKLAPLKRSRGAHRGVLTRRATAVRQAGGALEDVQATLEFLIDRQKMLTELDSQIQQLIEEDDELEADVDEAADVFLAAEREVKWCQARIKELQPPSPSAAAAPSSGSLTTKLPKLALPSFSGEYTQWVSFWDQFTTLVDSKSDMANLEKLSYLKLSLKGDAAQIVSSLLVTDTNYDIAKRKLEENKRSIVKAHLASIHALPAIKKESSVELRKLLESTNEHVQALEALRLPVNHWDAILVYCLLEKLDAESRKQFELAHPGTDVLTFKELPTFMDRRSRALESSGDQPEASTPKTTPKKVLQEAYSSTVDHSTNCQMKESNGSHSISQCDRYKQLGTRERKTVVRKLKLCMNYLGRHFVADCPSKFSCRTCKGRHHTSLHFEVEQQSGVTSGATFSGPYVLLSTAMVGIDDTAGKSLMFRALLDSGSQTTFITAEAASKLNLARSTVDVKISGIGGRQQAAKESVSLLVGPQKLSVTALVLNSIAGNIPSQSINLKQLKSMKSVAPADKNFHQPGPVQLLLGADVYENLFLDERKKHHGLHYRKSIFGWVVTGVLSEVRAYQCQSFQVAVELNLARFLEVEEIPRVKPMSKENRQCVEHYDTTTYVAEDGRITVRRPFKSEARTSNNFQTAKQRLFALERKLKDHDEVKQQYRDFIKEFVDIGHLEQALQTSSLCYYLPHHCVFKDSTTTKLRVVFDASSKSPNGNSLNDCLLLGPRLQDEVFDILIRFRLHQFSLSADVAKMYRQVALDESDRDFHRILWRDYVTDEIRELRMTRVMFGVASSSYHSTRALQESGKLMDPIRTQWM